MAARFDYQGAPIAARLLDEVMKLLGWNVGPIRPRVTPNHAAVSADHARPERRHRNVVAVAVDIQDPIVATLPARHGQAAHAVLTHVA
jgi:hypothetical protein